MSERCGSPCGSGMVRSWQLPQQPTTSSNNTSETGSWAYSTSEIHSRIWHKVTFRIIVVSSNTLKLTSKDSQPLIWRADLETYFKNARQKTFLFSNSKVCPFHISWTKIALLNMGATRTGGRGPALRSAQPYSAECRVR